jgi:hypothetical protein
MIRRPLVPPGTPTQPANRGKPDGVPSPCRGAAIGEMRRLARERGLLVSPPPARTFSPARALRTLHPGLRRVTAASGSRRRPRSEIGALIWQVPEQGGGCDPVGLFGDSGYPLAHSGIFDELAWLPFQGGQSGADRGAHAGYDRRGPGLIRRVLGLRSAARS